MVNPDHPSVAIISNGLTPYGTHVYLRVARELRQIRLWTLYTHELIMSRWSQVAPAEINPVMFGAGENAGRQVDPRTFVHEWRKGGRIIAWLKEHDIRAVVLLGYNGTGRLRIIRWCRATGIPCLLFGDSNIKGDLTRGPKAWLKTILVRWAVRQCSALLPCGRLGRAYFEKYGAPADRIFYFPYEPDYDLIGNLSSEFIEQTRNRFGLAPGRRRIVYSGRLATTKRVDLAIEAFIAIAERRPEWDLVVVGDGPLRQELAGRIPPSLGQRVIWTGFLSEQAPVNAVYRVSDVLVLPSDREPWALVVNEAAAAGLAIVASDAVGAAAEIVRDGVNGHLFPPGDLPALTECLLRVTDPQRIDAMKAASPSVLEEWRRCADPVQGLRNALRACDVNA